MDQRRKQEVPLSEGRIIFFQRVFLSVFPDHQIQEDTGTVEPAVIHQHRKECKSIKEHWRNPVQTILKIYIYIQMAYSTNVPVLCWRKIAKKNMDYIL